jgi:hypothetical protein
MSNSLITFGGSPTGVAVPPMFEKMTVIISTGTGFSSMTSHRRIVTGVISKIVVTLSRKDETTAVKSPRQIIKGQTSPLVILIQLEG